MSFLIGTVIAVVLLIVIFMVMFKVDWEKRAEKYLNDAVPPAASTKNDNADSKPADSNITSDADDG